jgi:hypothetical protein
MLKFAGFLGVAHLFARRLSKTATFNILKNSFKCSNLIIWQNKRGQCMKVRQYHACSFWSALHVFVSEVRWTCTINTNVFELLSLHKPTEF